MTGHKLFQYLYQNHVRYDIIKHPVAFTAQGIAHASHLSGKELAKTVIIKIDGRMVMMVLPANYKLNIDMLRSIFWTDNVELAHEDEIGHMFPDCELGGMPPFGNLYGMEVYVSRELTQDGDIAFNAGNHSELVRMHYNDFARMVHPSVMDFALR